MDFFFLSVDIFFPEREMCVSQREMAQMDFARNLHGVCDEHDFLNTNARDINVTLIVQYVDKDQSWGWYLRNTTRGMVILHVRSEQSDLLIILRRGAHCFHIVDHIGIIQLFP